MVLILMGLTGCLKELPVEYDSAYSGLDNDGDGVVNSEDCDDNNNTIYPGADEVCDGLDNDCDGDIDEDGDPIEWFEDADGDGWGNPDEMVEACSPPVGYVATSEDCDDTDANISPDGEEVCDGVDNDCDGDVDVNATDMQEWYADEDGDGFGTPDTTTESCDQPLGYVSASTDCDDQDATVHPNADEICDGGVDNDCDGLGDDDDVIDDASTLTTWYQDSDGDGFGTDNITDEACEQPVGYAPNSTDCDDTDPTVNPAEAEVCGDGIDNDCDPTNDAIGSDWYPDTDGDGYGDGTASVVVDCTQPSGYELDNTDCDDTDASINPGEAELCDGTDNNCSGDEDDASDVLTWYLDADSDGHGDASSTDIDCFQPSGYVADNTDCNDGDSSISPSGIEICDSADVDEDCDGLSDDADSSVDSSTGSTFYADGDGDTYGDASNSGVYCDAPSGYVADSTDCDDGDSGINPGATEVCDSADVDEDCNGVSDDNDSGTSTSSMSDWYADSDSDSYGDATTSLSQCDQPSGYVSDDQDCDDTDASINPDTVWYADSDSDGYGDAATTLTQCTQPSGYVLDDSDCDDADASTGTGEWYDDTDGDGYGLDSSLSYTCTPTSAQVSVGGDCDDSDSSINPDSVELYFDLATATETDNCDGVDSDCDGDIDEGCTDDDGDGVDDGAQLMFACDLDSDGYANSLCMPQAFSGSWLGSDCMYTFTPFNSSITLSSAKTPVSVEFGGNTYDDVCYINGGGSTGTFYVTAVSDIGSDGSTTVDTSDPSDWVHADLSWCDYYSSTICYNAGGSVVDYAFQANWDGTEFTY
jgi:hypothetical protein